MSTQDSAMQVTPSQAKRPNPQPLEAAALPDALLTTPTACAALGLSISTLYRLAAAGKLTPVKLGPRCTRWRAAQVRAIAQG